MLNHEFQERLYPVRYGNANCMMFVDGENLAIRFQEMVKKARPPGSSYVGIWQIPDVAAWSQELDPGHSSVNFASFIRRHYYTSVIGDDDKITETIDWIKDRKFEAARVFKKTKNRGSKQVDISLATDMLLHACHGHYDIAVLVAGDGDYVPLVRAVKGEGKRVHVWFLSEGISPKLKQEADYFVTIDAAFML
jgi:uncharacterized LabA/DUF88 family protein